MKLDRYALRLLCSALCLALLGISCGEEEVPQVGDALVSLSLPDCDGQMHDLRSLCERQAGWVFAFAAWCPPCRRFAEGAEDLYQTYEPRGLGAFFLITETESFEPPDASSCSAIRERYGLTMPVLYDGQGQFQEIYGVPPNDINIVTGESCKIVLKEQYSSEQVQPELELVLPVR